MNELHDSKLDEQLRSALGSPPVPDFDAWRDRHGESINYLNPVVTKMYQRRRRFIVRIASAAAAAVLFIAAATWLLGPQQPSFAKTVDAINKAETITCTITWYNRMVSQDGKRTWLVKLPRWERSYLAPARFRDVHYDEHGNLAWVDIEDAAAGKVLHLDMKAKTAMLKNERSGQFGDGSGGNPFAGIAKVLEREPIEYVGQRDVNGSKVNVFRHRKELLDGAHETTDYWLDAKTKQLVGYCNTDGTEPFDPATAPDRDNPPEARISKGTIAGVITGDIVIDAQLDPKLFSLTPPDGFTIVEAKARPKVTEEMLIEWLGVSARANGGTFVDKDMKAAAQWRAALYKKSTADRSQAEKQFLALELKHARDKNFYVMGRFADDATEPHSFQYIGKGAKLGDSSRIICWYKLTGTGKYRAVFGDLKTKEVKPEELPRPVEK